MIAHLRTALCLVSLLGLCGIEPLSAQPHLPVVRSIVHSPAVLPPCEKASPPLRGSTRHVIVFVHGIKGNCARMGLHPTSAAGPDYPGLFAMLGAFVGQHPDTVVVPFAYYQDAAMSTPPQDGGQACDPNLFIPPPLTVVTEVQRLAKQRGLYVNDPDLATLGVSSAAAVERMLCGSQSDLAINAVLLDYVLNLYATPHTDITIIGHSMGAAITRAWLGYAQNRVRSGQADPALHAVHTIITMQGAQEGSPLAHLPQLALQASTWPLPFNVIYPELATFGRTAPGLNFDPGAAAAQDLAPLSHWYQITNAYTIPSSINYYNFYTDIQMPLVQPLPFMTLNLATVHLGDLVLPPGSDDPKSIGDESDFSPHSTDLMLKGGAKFLPCSAPLPPNCHEWLIQSVPVTVSLVDVATLSAMQAVKLLAYEPASHLNFGSALNASPGGLQVNDCVTGQVEFMIDQLRKILGHPSTACGTPSAQARVVTHTMGVATDARSGAPAGGVLAPLPVALPDRPPAAGQDTTPRTFIDASGRLLLSLEVHAGSSASAFALRVLGRGVYVGSGLLVQSHGPTATVTGAPLATFYPDGGGAPRPPQPLQIAGTINVSTGSASVSLGGPTRNVAFLPTFLLTPRIDTNDAVSVTQRLVRIFRSRRLSDLFALEPRFLQTPALREELARLSATFSRPGPPAIMVPPGITVAATGTVQASPYGYTFFKQAAVFHAPISTGMMRGTQTHIYLIWDSGGWRYWGTAA